MIKKVNNKIIKKEKKKLLKIQKEKSKNKLKYIHKSMMKKRYKNAKVFSNVKEVGEDGLIELKTGGYASLIEIKAIDLSLSSNQEKNNFFNILKNLYQIKELNLKCFKLEEKINLNNNKLNIEKLKERFKDHLGKTTLLDESLNLIDELENNNYTLSSVYY